MKKITWEWLAGFYEGEGCAGSYITARNESVFRIAISQSNFLVLAAIKKFLKIGCVAEHGPSYDGIKRRKSWNFQVTGMKAARLGFELLPHMRHPSKVQQLTKALNVYRARLKKLSKIKEFRQFNQR